MTTSESSVLRPLGVGQILDRAVRLYRRNFATFIGIIAVMLVPLSAIQLAFSILNVPKSLEAVEQFSQLNRSPNPLLTYMQALSSSTGGGATIVVGLLSFVLVQCLATAALVRTVGNSYLGEKLGVFEAYGRSTRTWLALFLALVVGSFLLIGILIFMIIPCIGWLFGPGLLFYFTTVIYQLIPVVLVLENKGVGGSIRRAWDLVRRRFWWVLGFVMLLALFSYLVVAGPATLINLGMAALLGSVLPINDPATALTVRTVVSQVTTLLLQLAYLPLQTTAIILMYFDLRIRTEGFDLSVMAAEEQAKPETPPNVEEIIAQAPPPARDSIITGNELLYFAGVTIGAFALFAVVYGLLIMFFLMIGLSFSNQF